MLKRKGRGRFKEEWRSVTFTDRLTEACIAEDVENWSKNYKVLGARYNGRRVTIPTKYHWEHRVGDEVIGRYGTRKEARTAWEMRRESNYGKPKDERVPVGMIVFVKD